MELKENLGKQIQILRKNKKLTQEQFADIIGIDPKNVSKIENGKNYPTAETLVAIAKALEVEFYELFLFGNEISYEDMKQEIVNSLDNRKNILMLYKALKGII